MSRVFIIGILLFLSGFFRVQDSFADKECIREEIRDGMTQVVRRAITSDRPCPEGFTEIKKSDDNYLITLLILFSPAFLIPFLIWLSERWKLSQRRGALEEEVRKHGFNFYPKLPGADDLEQGNAKLLRKLSVGLDLQSAHYELLVRPSSLEAFLDVLVSIASLFFHGLHLFKVVPSQKFTISNVAAMPIERGLLVSADLAVRYPYVGECSFFAIIRQEKQWPEFFMAVNDWKPKHGQLVNVPGTNFNLESSQMEVAQKFLHDSNLVSLLLEKTWFVESQGDALFFITPNRKRKLAPVSAFHDSAAFLRRVSQLLK